MKLKRYRVRRERRRQLARIRRRDTTAREMAALVEQVYVRGHYLLRELTTGKTFDIDRVPVSIYLKHYSESPFLAMLPRRAF